MDMVHYNDLVNETCEGQNILTELADECAKHETASPTQ